MTKIKCKGFRSNGNIQVYIPKKEYIKLPAYLFIEIDLESITPREKYGGKS